MALLTLENNVEDYLKDIEIENFDESMSFMDCSLYVVAEGERMWNDIMKEMAIEELRYLSENGVEMIYEAEDAKGFFTKAKEVMKALAGKIAGFFKTVFEKINYFVRQHKAYAKKHKSDIEKGYNLIPDDGIKMKKFYKFENLSKIQADTALATTLDSIAKSSFGLNHVLTATDKDDIKKYLESIKNKDNVKTALNGIRAQVMEKKGEGLSASEFKKELITYLLGTEVSDKVVRSDIDCAAIISDLEKCSEWTKEAKKSFKAAKESINTIIKRINEFDKNVSKDDQNREAKLSYCKSMVELYKGFIQITTTVKGVQFSLHQRKVNQSLAVSTKLVALAKQDAKAKGKEDKKEEKVNESSTYQWEDGMNFFTSDLL